MIVATNYFTKWFEVILLSGIRNREIITFMWQHIICRFDILKEIVVDSGAQFSSKNFSTFVKNRTLSCTTWHLSTQNLMGKQSPPTRRLSACLRKKLATSRRCGMIDYSKHFRHIGGYQNGDWWHAICISVRDGCGAPNESTNQHSKVDDWRTIERESAVTW